MTTVETAAREHAIKRMCVLQSLVAQEVHQYAHAADCFCGALSDNWYEKHYRNEEVAIDFIENAVVDAVATAKGISTEWLRKRLVTLASTEEPA